MEKVVCMRNFVVIVVSFGGGEGEEGVAFVKRREMGTIVVLGHPALFGSCRWRGFGW